MYDEENSFESWSAMRAPGKESKILQTQARFPNKGIKIVDELMKHNKRGSKDYVLVNEGEKSVEWLNLLKKNAPELHASIIKSIGKQTKSHWSVADFLGGAIIMVTYGETDVQARNLLRRCANVFEQAYIRFLDLKKAEAQAREAQIEAALEKVRSVAMSMHHSNELLSICESIYVELLKLNMTELRNTMINIHNDADETFLNYDYSAYAGKAVTKYGYHIHPIINQLVMQCRSTHDAFLDIALAGEEFETWRSFRKSSGEKDDKRLNSINHLHYYFYSIGIGSIGISTFESIDNEKLSLLKRFRNVFQLAYQRFTDLLAAETQAREAQIESSLERVRSKTMAMHNSDDVGETVATLFDELVKLGVHTNRCGILICGESKTHAEVWTAKSNSDGNATLITGQLELNLHPLIEGFYRSWKKKKEVFSYTLKGDDMVSYYKAINNSKYYPTNFNLKKLPEQEVHTDFYFSDGAIFSFSPSPIEDAAASIFKRFANVFGQTYRRYLDLQKAESSARESQIEAALERVRGKAMAMHSSLDISSTIEVVFEEIKKLGIQSFRSGIGLIEKDSRNIKYYSSGNYNGEENFHLIKEAKMDSHELLLTLYDKWSNQEDYFFELEGKALRSFYAFNQMEIPINIRKGNKLKQYGYSLSFTEGVLYGWSERAFTESEKSILKRFRAIVALTFRRYIELQNAEANALEALRSASLDRVRAEIASMRNTNDLERITPVIWKELTILNIPFVRCGVFIMDEQEEMIHTFLSTPDGKAIASLHLPYESTPLVNSIESWRAKKIYQTHWGLDTYAAFAKAIANEGSVINTEHYLSSVPKEGIHLHLLPFLQGMLYVGNTEPLSADNLNVIQSVADAFSTAYARYEDFIKLEDAKEQIENTLTDLQAAQKQLIQSEKMASLGELTAGIAHEIQNPLNFVNNFSEVSGELISEMVEEVDKGNFDEVKAIADDVKQNLEKINHHGQRAADIVKGMLQHSRSSSGVKEPTDINALADEYLRLAYHGLRAKDKTFNATMKTDFDESIGKVNIIPQDIGRVVLNLITNAFYVVNEKKKNPQPPQGGALKDAEIYEPTVWVSTKKLGDKVFVSVKDNGNGIPPKILDKIFQPFFTTKPTGQGTGLGLSLSYDIVKAHGGELKVETKEGEGTEFSIVLSI
ncbi:MAG: ATP-binding protein [Sphingobacteriia bacterium]